MKKLFLFIILFPLLAQAQNAIEDSPSSSGMTGIIPLSKRTDTPTTSAGTDGDFAYINSDANGALYTKSTGLTKKVCVAITPDTSAYAANDIVGGKLTFASLFTTPNYTGTITSVEVTNTEIDGIAWDLCFFSADPTGSTVADQGALTLVAADLQKAKCVSVSDGRAFAATSLYQAQSLGLAMTSTTGTIYAVLRTTGTPTWAAAQTVNVCTTAIND